MLSKDVIKLLLIITALSSLCRARNFEFRLIQSNNFQRQELLQQKCDKYDLGNNELYPNSSSIHSLSDADLEHLLIDRKHKFLYCYVPKVSRCTPSFIDNGSFHSINLSPSLHPTPYSIRFRGFHRAVQSTQSLMG